ncbi:MAG: helix-turn-helix domain-containing protein [Flavobacteriaceae bacterium]|uniref:helix-turn-helix domain-containing protein n=1 Tax=Flagellimonas sp. SN16 TaxID=3415142 RepID=UPI003C62747F|nr:helix-turn-helix domain-containing protein [Flavobacteriaceae bacterium]
MPNRNIRFSEDENGSAQKYEKSGLTIEQALRIKEKVEMALKVDKLYRNNALGLNDLSYYIEEDRYKVSQVLNEHFEKNFYSLLNHYRIREAKDLLLEQSSLSVKAIMYEVGFNSKTSFYSAFKKETGVTPNDYRSIAEFAS